MAETYVNIRYILDRILRHPLMQEVSLEEAVDMTVSFMRVMGVPDMFIEKAEVLNVQDYRAPLPCDYYKMVQVRCTDGHVFRYSTDSFHMSNIKTGLPKSESLTYKIQGNIIYTSVKECEIEIIYEAIAVDSEGYPMIPDNSSFTRALELYIKKQRFTVLFDMGRISLSVLQNVQQEYAWAAGDCHTEFNRLSLDKAESFYNSLKTMLIRDNEHSRGFIDNGDKEFIKVH